MGLQENHWQQMQTNLDRDSISSLLSPRVPMEMSISRDSSQRSFKVPSRFASRRSRIRGSMTGASVSTTSSQSSEDSRASAWQQRLAEAQMEYLEHAPALLRKRSVNFLSISKTQVDLGSPTPPDSVDSGTDIETESESEQEPTPMPQAKVIKVATLWKQTLPSPKAAVGRMWNSPHEKAASTVSPDPPAKNLRPAQRLIQHALPIFTTDLWTSPSPSSNSRPVVGLWGSKFARPKNIITRRVTQRPERKSKRVTFLPDIGMPSLAYFRN